MDNQVSSQQTTKPNRKYKTFYEGLVPSGPTGYDINAAKWKNLDTGDLGQDIYVEHHLKKGKDAPKLLGKMKLPMRRSVLKAFIFHLQRLHDLSPEEKDDDDF